MSDVPHTGIVLSPGDRVRFRRAAGQHWQEGVVEGRERDGSVALRDAKGASRAIHAEHIEVYDRSGRRGRWVPALDRQWQQLALFAADHDPPRRPLHRRPPRP